jgi:hypothetical protein
VLNTSSALGDRPHHVADRERVTSEGATNGVAHAAISFVLPPQRGEIAVRAGLPTMNPTSDAYRADQENRFGGLDDEDDRVGDDDSPGRTERDHARQWSARARDDVPEHKLVDISAVADGEVEERRFRYALMKWHAVRPELVTACAGRVREADPCRAVVQQSRRRRRPDAMRTPRQRHHGRSSMCRPSASPRSE